jgi:hypothetical protein
MNTEILFVMRKKQTTLLLFGFAVFVLFGACNDTKQEPAQPNQAVTLSKGKEVDFTVRKVKKQWMVVESKSGNPKRIEAARNDTIVWRAQGSDMQFQFPDSIGTYFTNLDSDTTGSKYYLSVNIGKTLRLKVKPTAVDTTLIYSVLVKKDCVFAEGSSPPVILIRR